MVAYSFKPRFAPLILAGAKVHTLRGDRKRHARPDEQVQLFVSQRHPTGFKLGNATCISVDTIRLDFDARRVESGRGTAWTTEWETDAFAKSDGFQGWADLAAFWAAEHPDMRQWSGVIIRWVNLVAEADAQAKVRERLAR